jgi:hypothetical protein
MIIESVEVKSDNKLLATIDIEKFDTIDEAVSHYESKGDEPGQGEPAFLGFINAQHKASVSNAKRVELTKEVSPISALKAKIKSDPTAKAKLAALLQEFGIGGELVA